MSEISSNSTVSLVLADFASIDGAGKANIIGGGISFIGVDSASNTSVSFALYVQVSAAVQSLQENEASIEILLQDMDGNQVMLPGHTGTPVPMRIA